MINTVYICPKGKAANILNERNWNIGCFFPVFGIDDDFSSGDLSDADEIYPFKRIVWLRCLSRNEESQVNCLKKKIKNQTTLIRILNCYKHIVIWMGNRASDQIMLMLLAYMAPENTSLSVVNVASQKDLFGKTNYRSSIEMYSPNHLVSATETILTIEARAQLASMWIFWKSQASGWRDVDIHGNLIQYPLDYFDDFILNRLSQSEPRSLANIVEVVAEKYSAAVSLDYLYWRLMLLNDKGIITITKSSSSKKQHIFAILK